MKKVETNRSILRLVFFRILTIWSNYIVKLKMATEIEQNILIAARKEFEEKGFNGARMQSIADLAGISKPSLHYYYRSKENIFQKIFDQALDELMPLLNTWSNDSLTWEEKIKTFIGDLVAFAHEGSMLFLIREINRNPVLLEERIKNKPKSTNKVVSYFEAAMAHNEMRKTDPRVLYMMIHSICSFPALNSQMFQKTLRMSEKNYDDLMKTYAATCAELIIHSLKIQDNP